MTALWIASDWHLGPASPPSHGRLAIAFLERARAAGVEVVLNGDVFEDLFEGGARAREAHPSVETAIQTLEREGRLHRTAGNHDPDAGPERLVVDRPGIGSILIAHGHSLDPIHASAVGRLGDAVSRRLGRAAIVRGAARLAEAAARAVAEERMLQVFRGRCLRAIEQGGFTLGIFGHVHRASAGEGDRYVNAGALRGECLEFAVAERRGVRIDCLRP